MQRKIIRQRTSLRKPAYPRDLHAGRRRAVPVVASEAAQAQVRVILARERTPVGCNSGRSGERRAVGRTRTGPGWAVAVVAAETAETDVVTGASTAYTGAP